MQTQEKAWIEIVRLETESHLFSIPLTRLKDIDYLKEAANTKAELKGPSFYLTIKAKFDGTAKTQCSWLCVKPLIWL